jgi:hypothetical protein
VSVVGGDIDRIDVAIAGDAALEGGERHQHDIVLVLAEAGCALRLQQADDLAAHLADADGRALGSPAPKNCWRTVSPSRQTPAPPRLLFVKARPETIAQSRAMK